MIRRVLVFLCLLSVTIAGLTVTGAAPASAGLTADRTCKNFYTGDNLRRLSVCALLWFSDVNTQFRAVVQMHTYTRSGVNDPWIDGVLSQSITINAAHVDAFENGGGSVADFNFGNDPLEGNGTTCRINGPSGPVGCSVANTNRLSYYSLADLRDPVSTHYIVQVEKVSWRDDRGQPHTVDIDGQSHPDTLPFTYQVNYP